MNLIEENFKPEEVKKKNNAIKIVVISIVIVVLIIIGIVCYLAYIENSKLRITLDGKNSDKLKDLIVIENSGTIYFPIREIAQYFGYESFNGEYQNKSEEKNKCFVQSENEIANFTLGESVIYKLDLTKNKNVDYEKVYIKSPIKAINGVLYVDEEGLEKAFNVDFTYNTETNRMKILTLPYLVSAYSPIVLDYGYTEMSTVFSNQKAIMQNLIVVQKANKQFGVINSEGNTILEAKYDNITFLPQVGDFLVESNKKVGTYSSSGTKKVDMLYDSLELMDSDAGLFAAKKDNKYGVVDFKGNIKIHLEYDSVGMDIAKFSDNNIRNKYLLANKLIPVQKDKLWGLFDINGNQVFDFEADSFGYVASNNKNAINLLVIPDYNVIVARKDKKYNLINSNGEKLLGGYIADDIYMTVNGGQIYYYINANDKSYNALEFLDSIGITNDSSNKPNTNKSKTNTENETNKTEENSNVGNKTNNTEQNSNSDN